MASPTRSRADGFPPLANVAWWQQRSASNLAAFYEHWARALERRRVRWDDALAVDMQCPAPIFNSVALLRPLEPGQADDLSRRLSRFYAEQPGAPWVLWSAWPSSELLTRGFEPLLRLPLMVRLPGAALPAPPPELRIVEVTDAATMADAERVAIEGYPLPELQPARIGAMFDARSLGGPLRMWVGYLAGRAVATASALIDEQVTGIYVVATLPEARGRGYGAAITAHAAAAAPALPTVLEATASGYPIYARLGFTEVTCYDLWVKRRST